LPSHQSRSFHKNQNANRRTNKNKNNMKMRLALLLLLASASNASLLRGKDHRELKKGDNKGGAGENKDDSTVTGGCGTKLSAETMVAFNLDPAMDCAGMNAVRDDFGCVDSPDPLDPISECTDPAPCKDKDPTWSCFFIPGLYTGPGIPIAKCGTREGIAAEVDTGKGIGVDISVPKEICSSV
jgi:hypothetical protein